MNDRKPAGFWIRFIALIVDGIAILTLSWVVAVLIGDEQYFQNLQTTETVTSAAEAIGSITYIVIFIILFTASQLKGSPGKLLLRIEVLDRDMNKISILRSIARYFSQTISTVIFFIGFMMAGWNKEKKALHDMICNTRVVYREKNKKIMDDRM
ncbi:RDD family protein [Halalkalibacillus halophilus]|uniref:RDD family protein n=1 Tax=Halalkalibacillus halophilus TaxID=392827 RepID=UPI00041B050C|nr:RDD family protein [Halalkalibacillus halophilus]